MRRLIPTPSGLLIRDQKCPFLFPGVLSENEARDRTCAGRDELLCLEILVKLVFLLSPHMCRRSSSGCRPIGGTPPRAKAAAVTGHRTAFARAAGAARRPCCRAVRPRTTGSCFRTTYGSCSNFTQRLCPQRAHWQCGYYRRHGQYRGGMQHLGGLGRFGSQGSWCSSSR